MKTLLGILCFIVIGQTAFGTKYYVSSSSGVDAGRDGKSPATAWKTLAKINSTVFVPGDTILLCKGDTWRELLTVPSSGTASSYIVFGNYGSGANPRILGSEVSAGWTNYSGNVWVSVSSFTNPRSSFNCDIFFVATTGAVTFGLNKSAITSLAAEYDWTWSGNKIYVYCPVNPATRYAGVEIPQRQSSIDLNNREYIGINGIDMHYGVYEGLTYDWNYPQLNLHGLTIENCEIGYIGGSITNLANENGFGIDVAYSDMTVRKCDIHDCGRRGISFHLYGSGFTVKNVLIEQNSFHNGYHTTGVDISVGSGSYTGSFDGVTIRRNTFYDPPDSPYHSEQIFVQNYNYSTLTTSVNNINIYSNIFRSPSGSSIMVEGTQSVYIHNNTFYNHNTTKSGCCVHLWIDANNAMIKVKNNIFYTDLGNDSGGNGLAIFSLTDFSKIEADYNLYYRISGSLNLIKTNGTSYTGSTMGTLRTATGWEKNGQGLLDPKFTAAAQTDFTLTSSSPAIGKGINCGVPCDYCGIVFCNPPDIGCYAATSKTNAPPVVSITSPVNNANYNAPALVVINATASDPDGTVSKVEFYNGATLLGQSTASPFTCNWTNVPAGNYSITAVATDNGNAKTTSSAIAIAVTATVNVPPVVTITSPANNTNFNAPASVAIRVSASDPDGTISKVEFYNGTSKLGESAISPYTYNWNNVAAGTYTLTADATDDKGAKTTSQPVTVTVSVVTIICTPTFDNNDIVIYPNPNNGVFSIKLKESLEADRVLDIIDMAGRKVYSETWFMNETQHSYNLSYIPGGFYLARLSNAKCSNQKKLIKR